MCIKLNGIKVSFSPRVGFLVTSFRLISKDVVKTYNGRTDMENRIKEGKNTLRRDWAS